MYGGDEPMHGNDPTQGIELCSVVELMFSLETMLPITGDLAFADHLELIAYNALPAQTTEDYNHRQYFQCANQVLVSRARRNFYEEDGHGNTDLCFGLLTGYPCCTCNMHQGWPKLVQNLWYATPDAGLAALLYAPSEVEATVADGVRVRIIEETRYPFEETVQFKIEPEKPVSFPLRLRLPDWTARARITINDQPAEPTVRGRELTLQRRWGKGDTVKVLFPAEVRTSRWVENSVAIQRGPLVYALRIEEEWRNVKNSDQWGGYLEVHPGTPWNYGLLDSAVKDPNKAFEFHRKEEWPEYPWTLASAPVELRAPAKRIPEWQLYNHKAGPLPHSRPQTHLQDQPAETVTLVPYGCTRLRITEFPVIK